MTKLDLLLNTCQYLNYYQLKNIYLSNKLFNTYEEYLFKNFEIKANIIKRFFKYSNDLLKNIHKIELVNTKLMGLYYFKSYEIEFAKGWIEFPCDWKFNIIKNSNSYKNIINQDISVKYKLFKIQQNLTLQDIEYIGW